MKKRIKEKIEERQKRNKELFDHEKNQNGEIINVYKPMPAIDYIPIDNSPIKIKKPLYDNGRSAVKLHL